MTRPELPRVVEPGSDEHIRLIGRAYQVKAVPAWVTCYARDCYRAGRNEGARARAAAPAARRGVAPGRSRAVDLAIEILASASTLAGMRLGSTTVAGASIYIVATCAWCAISWRKGLHGIWPLNIGALVVMIFNLKDALA